MFISWQTFESLQITCHSTVELIKYLLSNNVKYVLSERFSQDPLENYFGRQRSMGSRRDNPNARVFGYQDNTIRNSKSFKPIKTGNCKADQELDFFKASTETVLCRKRKGKHPCESND